MTDEERANAALSRWAAAHTFHFIPCDPRKGENPEAWRDLVRCIADAIAAARNERQP